jgi:hypothetical protein
MNSETLTTLDYTKPTELCLLMGKYGSDKGSENISQSWHNYTVVYNKLFKERKNENLNIFELGLGTNNVKIPSNMSVNEKPGASLFGWREYFPNSNIYGADINKQILFKEERIKTFFCDQTNPSIINNMWNEELKDIEFDVIVDKFEANCCFFENSIQKLKSGGFYIIEDILNGDHFNMMKFKVLEWEKKYTDLSFLLLSITSTRNTNDNNILIIKKRPLNHQFKITLVSAFYSFKNKYGDNGNVYITWMKNFLPFCNNGIVLFVENIASFKKLMKDNNINLPSNIILQECLMDNFLVSKYNWDFHHSIDVEKSYHNIGLYKIWNEKVNFLKKTLVLNPYNSDFYIWMDIGCVRDRNVSPFITQFPDFEMLEHNKIHMLEIKKHTHKFNGEIIDFNTKIIESNLGAGIFGGDIQAINTLHNLYYNLMDEYFLKMVFAGKDQNIFYNLYLRYPNLFKIIPFNTKNWMIHFQNNIWFYMINFLISPKNICIIKPLNAGLGNILFQIISSYCIALDSNSVYFINDDIISSHSKKNYNFLVDNYIVINKNLKLQTTSFSEIRFDTFTNFNNFTNNFTIHGYLQNEKYFKHHRNQILDLLKDIYTPSSFLQNNLQYDYFIHVRRGDYLTSKLHYIPLEKYYQNALNYIQSKHPNDFDNLNILVFSDDIEWCRNFFNFMSNVSFIENLDEYESLKLMVKSKCGGIGSNSSFSWWGLWLNKNPNTIKILPNKWIHGINDCNIYFEDCIKLSCD